MHIECVRRGSGSAGKAAGDLVGDRDAMGREPEGVEGVRGDPDVVAAAADSLEFEHKYRSIPIEWAPEDRPTDAQINAVLDEFEKIVWAGLDADRYSWTAVLHREDGGGVHVHVLTARCDLETDKSLNIAPPGLAEDLRPAARRLQPRAPLEPAGRPGAGEDAAARPSRLHRGGEPAGRPRARGRPARVDPGLPSVLSRRHVTLFGLHPGEHPWRLRGPERRGILHRT